MKFGISLCKGLVDVEVGLLDEFGWVRLELLYV